jgi:hypothetical protein
MAIALLSHDHINKKIQPRGLPPLTTLSILTGAVKYDADAQQPVAVIMLHKLNKKEIKRIWKIVGSILYYARMVDMTVLMALIIITSKHTKRTEQMMEKELQVLDYLATHPHATVHSHASNMILNIHLDASYLLEPNSQSRASLVGSQKMANQYN